MKKKLILTLFFLFNCASKKGFLVNNYQPKDRRIGETILINHQDSKSAYSETIKYSLKENIELMEKCVEDSSYPIRFALKFTITTSGKVIDNSVEKLSDKEQRKCLNKVLSTINFQQPIGLGNVQVYQSINLNRN